MNMLSKIISSVLYVILIFSIINAVYKGKEREPGSAPVSLWYVYSQSMEPTLMTNDGFILVHSKEYRVNDIITFKPKALKQPYVTHRIVSIDSRGDFITKGDNNEITDQQGGEPLVSYSQIVGKALTINNKLIVIPQLSYLSDKIKEITGRLNVFTVVSAAVSLIIIEYIINNYTGRKKHVKKKKPRTLDFAPYFDYVFWIFCSLAIINILYFSLLLNNWSEEKISYLVVHTKGISSPNPGEKFSLKRSIESSSGIPFVVVLQPKNTNVQIEPSRLFTKKNKSLDYTVSLTAPDKIGSYNELIDKRVYINILPEKWFNALYSKHEALPLIIIVLPFILLDVWLYVLWLKRWQIGRREVMPWLLGIRRVVRSL